MADPIYFVNGPDTEAGREYAEKALRGAGCASVIHEPRGTGVICSMGYRSEVPGSIPLRVDTRTPVEAV